MGVVFALGFFVMIIFILGVISFIAGILIMTIRHFKRKKTQKKYRVSKVLGLIFLIIGLFITAIPVLLGIILGTGFMKEYSEQQAKDTYYAQHTNTAVQIEVEAEAIRNGIYLEDCFTYNNREYHHISGLTVAFEDIYRGKACANLNDGITELTVYEYLFPEGCEMLCAGERIYCTEEKMDELIEYYNNECDFSYQYRFTHNADFHYVDIDMNDDLFLVLINYDENYVSKQTDYSNTQVEYYIIQTESEGRLDRMLKVFIDENGVVMIRAISNPLSKIYEGNIETYNGQSYEVTNPEIKELLYEIGDTIKQEKSES